MPRTQGGGRGTSRYNRRSRSPPREPFMNAVLRRLLEHPLLGPKIVHHRRVEGRSAQFASLRTPLPHELVEALAATGIERIIVEPSASVPVTVAIPADVTLMVAIPMPNRAGDVPLSLERSRV